MPSRPIATVYTAEAAHNPVLDGLHLDQSAGVLQAGGNMEGKEVRFGIGQSALFATVTTASSDGAVDAMHDSFMPMSSLVLMTNMMLDEVIVGGPGSGLFGMLLFAIVAVFVAGLMIGRPPEYLGKKIEANEIKMTMLVLLTVPAFILALAAVAAVLPVGLAGLNNAGPPPARTPAAQTPPGTAPAAAPVDCTVNPDPYKNYACLDDYLGTDVLDRFYNYYRLEWGESGPPTDPNAPAGRRSNWDPAPETTPPMPFTDWPYGGTTALGGNRTGSADSPLMMSIANTSTGKWLQDNGIQIYGWIDGGANVSTNSKGKLGNAPIAYSAYPNTAQLD
jgi:hypothetical protein